MRVARATEVLRSLERIKLYTKAAKAHLSLSVPVQDMENVLSLIPDPQKSGLYTDRVTKWLALHGIKLTDIPAESPPKLQWDSLSNIWHFEVVVVQRADNGQPLVVNGLIVTEVRILPAPDFHV